MAHQDIDRLEQAIADASGVLSDSELAHAKKLLDFLKISQGRTLRVLIGHANTFAGCYVNCSHVI